MSHVEVTAVAVDTLLKLGVAPSDESVTRATDFIKKGMGERSHLGGVLVGRADVRHFLQYASAGKNRLSAV